MRWTHGLLARLRLLRRGEAEARMDEEIRFHIEMETEKNRRRGMSPGEARRRAVLTFGGVEGHREAMRDGRTLAWLGGLSLDLKLAWRILWKHPSLTLVGGLGMALAVAIGTLFFGYAGAYLDSTLPFDEGERIVALENRDTESNGPERRIVHELAIWREQLVTVEELGAWRPADRNLIVPGGPASPVAVAEMTASSFRTTRVPALLGRTLVEEDEAPGAPAVAVLGHDVWRSRLGGDPHVLGREVRLGGEVHTVVGVMPEGFRFPVSHGLWVPLRMDPSGHGWREGPGIFVFGRLAPGATLETAQAELETIGRRMAAASPETHERLRPRVVPYTRQFQNGITGWEFMLMQILVVMLLVVICVNVGALVYARTVARVGEIAVRSALGASRRRIVGQLFAEALLLSLGAAALGLTATHLVLVWWGSSVERLENLGFWIDFGTSPGTVLYALGLAVLGAAIVGVAPALRATGRGMRTGLGELSGGSGVRLGRTWTALIIAQVAIAAAILPATGFSAWNHFRYGFARPGFAAENYLQARLEMESTAVSAEENSDAERERDARYADRLVALVARLEAQPEIADVTFASFGVGATMPASLELEGVPAPEAMPGGHAVRFNLVDPGLFEAFGVPITAGRGFRSSDAGSRAGPVLVNQAFVDQVLGGRNAIGRPFRYTWRHRSMEADTTRWYEIVGVVGDRLVVGVDPGESEARVYHPLAPGELRPVVLSLRTRGGAPADLVPVLRDLAAAVDPALQLHDVLPLDEALRQKQRLQRLMGLAIALATLSVVLLSAAGIHAMVSFTVVQRRREIGIRGALGARPLRLIASIFSRTAGQLAMGLALGIGAAVLLNGVVQNLTGGEEVAFIGGAAALMMIVGLLAALGPALRGLRIQPMEALRRD